MTTLISDKTQLDLLPSPLLELALSTLPLRSVLAASSSCKYLHALTSSSEFARLHSLRPTNRSPWFFLFGINHFIPSKNQAFAFHPAEQKWLRLKAGALSSVPHHNQSSLRSTTNGGLFALAGPNQDRLLIASKPWEQNWIELPCKMKEGKTGAIVVSCIDEHRFLILGESEPDRSSMSIELFNGCEWETFPVPYELHQKATESLCAAMVGEVMYVASCYSSDAVWAFNAKTRKWKALRLESEFKGVMVLYWSLVSSETAGLIAMAVCSSAASLEPSLCIKLLRLTPSETESSESFVFAEEIAAMPGQMFLRLMGAEEDEEVTETLCNYKDFSLRCCAGGSNLVYVYSDSRFREYPLFYCELSSPSGKCDGRGRWRQAPALPPSANSFNAVMCVSSPVFLHTP